MKNIGQRIRAARLDRGMTLEAVGEAVGVSKGTISQWEQSTTTPRPKRISCLSKALGVSESWLLLGVGESHEQLTELRAMASDAGFWAPILTEHEVLQCAPDAAKAVANMDVEAKPRRPTPKAVGPGAFFFTVSGDAMSAEPGAALTIPDGFWVLVEPELELVDKKPVLAVVGDSVVVRILERDPGGSFLRPLNSSFRSIDVDENVRLIGPVTGIGRDL